MFGSSAVPRISIAGNAAKAMIARNAVPPACPAVAYSSETQPIRPATRKASTGQLSASDRSETILQSDVSAGGFALMEKADSLRRAGSDRWQHAAWRTFQVTDRPEGQGLCSTSAGTSRLRSSPSCGKTRSKTSMRNLIARCAKRCSPLSAAILQTALRAQQLEREEGHQKPRKARASRPLHEC